MKSIFYKFAYMLSGMLLLMALAVTMAHRDNAWQWWFYSLVVFFAAYTTDNETKASKG